MATHQTGSHKSFPVKETVFVNLTGGERTAQSTPKKLPGCNADKMVGRKKNCLALPDFGRSNGRGLKFAKMCEQHLLLLIRRCFPNHGTLIWVTDEKEHTLTLALLKVVGASALAVDPSSLTGVPAIFF